MIIPGKLTSGEIIELKSSILDIFNKYKLEINEPKTQMVYMNESAEYDYLGYCFRKENNKVQLHISKSKTVKMYCKMDSIFGDYDNNLNYELLRERLRVFSSVNKLFKTKYTVDRDGIEHYFKEPILFGINIDYKYAANEDIIKLNNYMKKCIANSTSLNRKQKTELYSMQIRNQYDNYRLIVYGKVPIMELKSIVYRISIGTYSWLEIMRMKKGDLISLYFKYIQLDK